MQKAGIVPKHQVLDNQASAVYKKAIGDSDMTCELIPPDSHRRNMAEKAIQTFKDHSVDVLSGCTPTFPLHLWCQLLPQVKRQLLLLQQSQLHPNLSAYVQVWASRLQQTSICSNQDGGPCTQQTTQTSNLWRTLQKAFVLGTSTKHFWCWEFRSTATQATWISGAMFFKHKYLTNTSVTPEDLVIPAATNLAWALETSIPQYLRVSTIQALKDLSAVFMVASHKYSNDTTIHMPNMPPFLSRPNISTGKINCFYRYIILY